MVARNDLSLRQLEYFVAVADTLGFHKAATRCHVSQPTLSAQIRELEGVLGVALFERDRRRVLVTEAGRHLAERARLVLRDVDELLGEAGAMTEPASQTFRIGVIPTVAPYLLPEVMPNVRRVFPKLKILFREAKTEELLRELEVGSVDACILALDQELPGFEHRELLRDTFVVAVSQEHPLANRKRLQQSELEHETILLLDDGHCFRDQALAFCSRVGAEEASYRATSLATLTQMVSMGQGITLLPALSVPAENRHGQLRIIPLSPSPPSRTIVLLWRSGTPFGSTFRALADALRLPVSGKRVPK